MPNALPERFALTRRVESGENRDACGFLAAAAHLSKSRIKDAMRKGAVWHKRGRHKAKRLRRATTPLRAGDELSLYYDAALLAREPPSARCFSDHQHYSVWFKPAGLLAQGNHYGDHCALLRQVEQTLQRPVWLVHRLDREAAGLMLVAHSADAAAKLSRLFHDQRVEKRYQVEVMGDPGAQGEISLPLDGKAAKTVFKRLSIDAAAGTSRLEVRITTGRKHQIRRHLAVIGHAVSGDPRYGNGNQNALGLQLSAVLLAFRCPFSGEQRYFAL